MAPASQPAGTSGGLTLGMKALVSLIVIMGIAIMVALAFVAYGIVGGGKTGAVGFGARDFALPAGCSLAAAELREDRILLRLSGPAEAGCQSAILIDGRSGAELGRLTGR